MQEDIVNNVLLSLSKSKFRSKFHLGDKDLLYVKDKGLDVIEKHTYDFVKKRLSPNFIPNDGKQTPMRGHPAFVGMHATGCCCRGCLFKWHHISKDKELSDMEIDYIVSVIMEWIKKELK